MLSIETFDQRQGGNVLYKALSHPLAAEALRVLAETLRARAPIALFDPEGIAPALFALAPDLPPIAGIYVQDARAIGRETAGLAARPLTELPESGARTVLIASFEAGRIAARIAPFLPAGAECLSLDAIRLPPEMLTVPGRYLDRLNFATNFAFFRDQDGLSTRLVSANYWSGYGANGVRLWLRLYAADGSALATWEEALPSGAGGFALDSRDIRARFSLPPFCGQLFLHVIGAAGHDVVKYALDTFPSADGAQPSLSCTHDANAWPSERYAGLPAPRGDERVILWVQNSHAVAIPRGAIALDRMGAERPVSYPHDIAPFASAALDVGDWLPDLRWPAQIEFCAGRHVVRPRYEVIRGGRTRIAHVNVERADLTPDPDLPRLPPALGRGFLLPFPILPRRRFATIVQPTPMATTQTSLPLRLDLFDPEGGAAGVHFLGNLPRDHDLALDLDTILPADALPEGGHGELVYDFRAGGAADGWLHALFRYADRESGHEAESSFGAHIFNTAMTYRDEPQSYTGKPPGLSTRLFLRLGEGGRRSFTSLIYPASAPWRPHSATGLQLHDETGAIIAETTLAIACSGSALIHPDEIFSAADLARAGSRGYVLIRDTTCRLFGYHGLRDRAGGFSLDHMFGF